MMKSIMCAVGVVGVVFACSSCAAVSSAIPVIDVVAPVIEGAVCTLAADQAVEPGWEKFLCTIAGDLASEPVDGGAAAQPQGTASFVVMVPTSQAKSFAAEHTSAAQAKRQ